MEHNIMNNKKFIILLVNLAIPLGGMSTDIYLPSLPAMTNYFHSPEMSVQLTITLFTLGLGIGQLFAGPISDAIGRKKLLIFGLILQLLSLILMITVHSINTIIIIRFVQGIGVALMMVPARAMLNDIFDGDMLKKQYTYMTASFALGPIVAPFIGGYLQHYLGWKSNFYFIMAYAIILLALSIIFLNETIAHKKKFSIEHMRSSYGILLKNRFFIASGLLVGFMISCSAVFNVAGPFLIQNLLNKSPIFYGYIALLMGAGWFSGNMTSRLFSNVSIEKKSTIAFIALIMISGVMLILSFSELNIYKLIIPILLMLFCAGFLFPMYVGECLSLFRKQAASANGVLFSFIWIMFSLFSFIATFLKAESFVPISVCYLSMAIFVYLWFLFMMRKR